MIIASLSARLAVFQRDDSTLTVQELVAPFFLGIVINFFLWGVLVTQSYHYYKSYRDTDGWWTKASVGLLFVTDLVESICASQAAWRFMVHGWGDLDGVSNAPGWGLYSIPLTDAFTAWIVHMFYAQKIWALLEAPYSYICTAFVVALSCLQFTGGAGCSIFMYVTSMTFAQFDRIKTWSTIWLVTASATDLIITATMSLRLSKIRTGWKKSDDLISKLIRLTVETGMATAVVQIVEIIVYLHWLHKPYHIVLGLMVPKVYSNSMLALLNSRQQRTGKSSIWESVQERTVDGIHIHTTQTVAVAGDYDMNKLHPGRRGSRLPPSDRRRTLDAGSTNSLPFSNKDPDYTEG